MEHRPEMLLQAVIKSMRDTVLPAIDADNAPAQQQGAISLALLDFILARMPLMFRYDQCELDRLLELAQQLLATHDDPALRMRCDSGGAMAAGLKTGPAELLAEIRALRLSINDFVIAEQDSGDPHRSRAARRAVVASASEMIRRERAWVLPFGFEADADAIPPIEALLS